MGNLRNQPQKRTVTSYCYTCRATREHYFDGRCVTCSFQNEEPYPTRADREQRRRDRGDYDGGFGDANCPADY